MNTDIHELERNDLEAAVAFLRQEAKTGPIGRDTLQALAMLQDEPSRFYSAIGHLKFEAK